MSVYQLNEDELNACHKLTTLIFVNESISLFNVYCNFASIVIQYKRSGGKLIRRIFTVLFFRYLRFELSLRYFRTIFQQHFISTTN